MRRAGAALAVVLVASAFGGGGSAAVSPAAAAKCFRAAHWHASLQHVPASRQVFVLARFYRGPIAEMNGWWVHFWGDRKHLADEELQLRHRLAPQFAAVLVHRGDALIGWEGPRLPKRGDLKLRDRCFPS
jgi:hypothetical protein